MKNLTTRQEEVLSFIRGFIQRHKFPPTFRDISDYFGISVRGAYDHTKALEKKGYLRCDRNRSRAIELLDEKGDREEENNEVTPIPVLGVVAAGLPIFAEENIDGTIPFPRRLLKSGNYFALTVSGESMLNAGIMDGDTAIIRQQNTANNGEIVVAMVDEAVTLKRYYKEPNRIQLKAENPNFPPLFVKELRILGILAHVVRSYS